MQIPCLAAAREVASSPSGWASLWLPLGAKPNGKGTYTKLRFRYTGPDGSEVYLLAKYGRTGIYCLHGDQDARADFEAVVSFLVFSQPVRHCLVSSSNFTHNASRRRT